MQHKIKFQPPFLGLLLLLTSTQVVGALPGESIVLDPNTGDYTITYLDYPGSPDAQIRQAIFVPATKIDPSVKTKFTLNEEGTTVYAYRVTNGLKSKQSLVTMRFDPVAAIISLVSQPTPDQNLDETALEQIYADRTASLTTPDGWIGTSFERQAGVLRISWDYGSLGNLSDGLAPGKTQGGFGFSSKYLPGIGVVQLEGGVPVPMFPAEGPQGELAKKFEPIEQNDYVSRNAAVPTIVVPVPFNAATLLGSIQAHVHTWIASGLLNATFSSQLDLYFQAAADAYSRNRPDAGKEHIDTLRKMLKREYGSLDQEEGEQTEGGDENKPAASANIDRLAARILDFDLKYVLERTDGG